MRLFFPNMTLTIQEAFPYTYRFKLASIHLVFRALNHSALPVVSSQPTATAYALGIIARSAGLLAPGRDRGTELALSRPANYRVAPRSLPYQSLPLSVVDSAKLSSYRPWESPAGEDTY